MNRAEAIKFKLAVDDSERFYFKTVENNNLNRMSLHTQVRDMPYRDFMVKLGHTDTSWAIGLEDNKG